MKNLPCHDSYKELLTVVLWTEELQVTLLQPLGKLSDNAKLLLHEWKAWKITQT